MIRLSFRAALAALAFGFTAPALAQSAPPAPPAPSMQEYGGKHGGYHGFGGLRAMMRNLSPEGRETLSQAMRSVRQDGTREQIEAARARMLDLLAAERLDVAAIQRVMLEERNLAAGKQQRMQAAMLGAYQRLSLADRRAFVASAREVRARVEERRSRWRERMRERRDERAI